MKKLLVFLLAVLALGFFSACDGGEEPQPVVPTFENVSIVAGNEAGTISLLVTAKERNATIYYIVTADDSKAPTAEQVKAGTDFEGVHVLDKGDSQGTLSKSVVLEGGTVYTVYVVLELNGVFSKTVYSNQVLTKTEEQAQDKGSGTPDDPFRISTVADLEAMLTDEVFVRDAYYVLTADLDLAEAGYGEGGKSWVPIGKRTASLVKFAGEFDGQNHTIKNLYINSTDSTEKWGLFAELDVTGVIKNLHLEDVNITSSGTRVGAVVGYSKGTVSNVSVTGTITGKDSGDADVGGIVGYQYQSGAIRYAYSAVNITAGGRRIGGIVGVSDVAAGDRNPILVSDCYSTGNIIGTGNEARQVGGIVGYARGTEFERVYASGDITGAKEVGGLIGFIEQREGNTIVPKLKNSFYMGARVTKSDASSKNIGKIVGNCKKANGEPVIENVYSLLATELVGGPGDANSTVDGTGVSMDNFKSVEWLSTTLKWNLETIWEIKEGALRPTLKGMADDGSYTVPAVPLMINLVEFKEGNSVGEIGLKIQTNQEADIYYVVVTADAQAPTAEQVIAMQDYDGVTLIASGTLKGTELEATLENLSEDLEYKVYVVAKLNDEVKTESKSGKPKGTEPLWGGEDPAELGYYPIYNARDLEAFSAIAAENNTVNAKLMADINLTGYYGEDSEGFLPIGNSSKKWKGVFDGNNHKIIGLFINRPDEENVGLFGYTDIESSRNKAATIKDLTIENANVTAKGYVGILIGRGKADVSNVSIVNGTVTAQNADDSRAGGLIGFYQQGILDKAYVKATVTGGKQVGVLIGNVDYSSDTPAEEVIIRNVVVEGSATGTDQVGGVVGYLRGTLRNAVSYATATITGDKTTVGAIAGYLQNRHASSQFKATLISAISFADNVKVIGSVKEDRGEVTFQKLFIVGTASPDASAQVVAELEAAWLEENTDFDLENLFKLDENKHLVLK